MSASDEGAAPSNEALAPLPQTATRTFHASSDDGTRRYALAFSKTPERGVYELPVAAELTLLNQCDTCGWPSCDLSFHAVSGIAIVWIADPDTGALVAEIRRARFESDDPRGPAYLVAHEVLDNRAVRRGTFVGRDG